VSGFASSFYWSSSKFNSSSSSWAQSFDKGSQSSSSRLNTFRVRAVRAF
jgi:hypothetical protein